MLSKNPFHSLVLVLFIFSVKTSWSQKTATGFGEFTQQEMALKECAFDKEAEAVVLLEKAESNYDDHYNLVTEHRIRIKVLKEKGIGRGDIHISYYSDENYEYIGKIEAAVFNYDAGQKPVWNKLDRKSVYNKKLNKYYSEISFALPNIQVGSIFEYKYESVMKSYGGLREWVFQKDIPVLLSSFNLIILPNAEFTYSIYKNSFIPITVKPDSQNGSVLFEMHDLPGLRDEKYMSAANDYLQRVKFQFSGFKRVENNGYATSVSSTTTYTDTWPKLAKELLDGRDFGAQLTRPLPDAMMGQLLLENTGDAYARMKHIHDYVRTHFTWNGMSSKFASDGLKGTLEKKTGTNGEINIILINFLKAAGLEADPLLVSERAHGSVDTTYPYLDQFSKVVAYVTIGDKKYILDGTDRQTPSFMVPFNLLNTTGFVVNKKKPALVQIQNAAKKNLNLITLTGTVQPSGSIELNATVDNYDYGKMEKKARYVQDKKEYEKDFFAPYAIQTIDSFSVSGAASDSLPLRHTAVFKYTPEKTGDYVLLNCNMFSGFDANPFISDWRFSDIDFGCNYTCSINGTFTLPENLTPDALPKNIKLVIPDHSMTIIRQVHQNGNELQVGIQIDFTKTLYSADEYPDVQDFYKQMLIILNEPILLKAKS